MNSPLFPVFLVEGEDMMIFQSMRDLQSQLEPSLIGGDEIAYDAKGRLLELAIERSQVKVFVAKEDLVHASELEVSLRKYLITMKEPLAKESGCGLPCLVDLSMKYAVKLGLRNLLIGLWHKT